jgi:hypothetical protein
MNISQPSTYLAVTDAGSHEAMAKFDQARRLAPAPVDAQAAADGDESPESDVLENLQETCKVERKVVGATGFVSRSGPRARPKPEGVGLTERTER